MIFLFTSSNKVGSRLIQWGTDQKSSHFCVCFADHIVLEAKGGGVQLTWFNDFVKTHKIVHALTPKLPMTPCEEFEIFEPIVNKVYGKPYDKKGLLYLAFRIGLKKFFGKPIKTSNCWGSSTEFFCVEIAEAIEPVLKELLKIDLSRYDLSMTTPEDLYNMIAVSDMLYEIEVEK